MPYLTQYCRELANYLGLKTNIIFVEFHEDCNNYYYALAKEKIPFAYYTRVGSCDDGMSSFSLHELTNGALKALDFANEHAYMVFSFVDTNDFKPPIPQHIKSFFQVLRSDRLHIRPVVITSSMKDFYHDLNITPHDVIILKHDFLDQKNEHSPSSRKLIDKIYNVLLKEQNHEYDLAKINKALDRSKPMLFSQPNVVLTLADLLAFAVVIMAIYRYFKSVPKPSSTHRRKLKGS